MPKLKEINHQSGFVEARLIFVTKSWVPRTQIENFGPLQAKLYMMFLNLFGIRLQKENKKNGPTRGQGPKCVIFAMRHLNEEGLEELGCNNDEL